MFLEIFTLLLLVGVLGTKYITSAHLSKLSQRITELENLYNQNDGRYQAVLEDRKVTEAEEKIAQRKLLDLETQMEDLRESLEEQEIRNQDLLERINEITS